LNVHRVSDVRQIEIHTAEPLVLDPSAFEVEIAIAKLKRYKSPCSDHFCHKLFEQEVKHYGMIYELINSIWDKELPDQWKESLIVPIHKKGSNYRGISLLSTSYKMLSNILVPSRLSPHTGKIIGDHYCGFRQNRSTERKKR
jgi:hypothetical protein